MRATIQKIREYGNRRGIYELYTGVLIIVVGLCAFALGRLSALDEQATPLTLERGVLSETAPALSLGGMFVASRAGSVYHYPWCPGAKKMAPANKVWLESAEEAKRKGYRPAKNCKGLEVE